jgi:hypothetical protein
LEADPSVRPSSQTGLNNHPIDLKPKDLEALLHLIQVSGYSGTIVGLMTKPQPVPLFTPLELSTISAHLATAFQEAKLTERVSFSLPKSDVTYSEDRTVGSLFFRGPYLHVIVTDHSSIIRTDTGGGDHKDLRDTKGMKLWLSGPTQAAVVPDLEEPRWAHFERVHISLAVKEVLAHKDYIPVAPTSFVGTGSPESRRGGVSPEDMQLQIRELSGSNQELRGRLDEQNTRVQQLQEQLEQLRRELGPSDPKGRSNQTVPGQ